MEQTNNIPEGYKDSLLGIIPKEWEVKCLREVGELTSSKRVYASDYVSDGIPFYRGKEISELKRGEKINDLLYISHEAYAFFKENFGAPQKDDILITAVGTLGNILRIKENSPFYFKDGNLIWIRNISDNSSFLEYKLSYEKKSIENTAIGSSQKALTIIALNNLKLAFPPLVEQQKIAEILSVWDEAIEKQTQLIIKLKTRKRGLMQQLLNGEKRLNGFREAWRQVKIGNIGEISSAGVDKKIVEGERPVRLLNYLDVYREDFIYSKNLNHWVTATVDKIGKCSIKKGDVFFTPSSEVPNDIGMSAVAMEDMTDVVYSYHIVRLRISEDWDLRYRAYAFKTDDFYKQAESCCDGSGQRYVISQANFRKMTIKVPPKEEQIAIANILSASAEKQKFILWINYIIQGIFCGMLTYGCWQQFMISSVSKAYTHTLEIPLRYIFFILFLFSADATLRSIQVTVIGVKDFFCKTDNWARAEKFSEYDFEVKAQADAVSTINAYEKESD